MLPDLCYFSSHCPEKNHASAQEKSGFQEAFRSQEALEGAAGFRGGGGPCFTALALWAPNTLQTQHVWVMLFKYQCPEMLLSQCEHLPLWQVSLMSGAQRRGNQHLLSRS